MYGQMTAGSWIYIGTQGILQGTYETLAEAATQRFAGTLAGTVTLTGGLGGGGGRARGGARLDRPPRQLRRDASRAAPARLPPGRRDGPDERARSARWVRPGRAPARGGADPPA